MADDTKRIDGESESIRVWDLPTRLFHWCLVLLLAFSWLTGELGEMEWHMRSGISILALVLFRLLWGVFGSSTSRFSQFVKLPTAAIRYARDLLGGKSAHSIGHNPLGGWMVVLLLALLLLQAGTGLFSNDDIFTEGPLYHLVSKSTSDSITVVHKTLFNILLACAALHIAAVVFYLLVKGENLITPMINGRKELETRDDEALPVLRSSLPALFCLGIAAAIVWSVLNFA